MKETCDEKEELDGIIKDFTIKNFTNFFDELDEEITKKEKDIK
tara:strand:- start:296 stop:424 length:129 start_codon:yes stop_codon:yes gene_type:complete